MTGFMIASSYAVQASVDKRVLPAVPIFNTRHGAKKDDLAVVPTNGVIVLQHSCRRITCIMQEAFDTIHMINVTNFKNETHVYVAPAHAQLWLQQPCLTLPFDQPASSVVVALDCGARLTAAPYIVMCCMY